MCPGARAYVRVDAMFMNFCRMIDCSHMLVLQVRLWELMSVSVLANFECWFIQAQKELHQSKGIYAFEAERLLSDATGSLHLFSGNQFMWALQVRKDAFLMTAIEAGERKRGSQKAHFCLGSHFLGVSCRTSSISFCKASL